MPSHISVELSPSSEKSMVSALASSTTAARSAPVSVCVSPGIFALRRNFQYAVSRPPFFASSTHDRHKKTFLLQPLSSIFPPLPSAFVHNGHHDPAASPLALGGTHPPHPAKCHRPHHPRLQGLPEPRHPLHCRRVSQTKKINKSKSSSRLYCPLLVLAYA